MERFLRQVLLPEIGEAGQRRLGASEAAVGGEGIAHEVAARYAEGAGFAAIVAGPVDVEALAPQAIVRTTAAREVLAGSRAALAEMRRALASSPENRS
ncbi:MAG: hypothetical protein QM820_63260 [Minicystis sp.]